MYFLLFSKSCRQCVSFTSRGQCLATFFFFPGSPLEWMDFPCSISPNLTYRDKEDIYCLWICNGYILYGREDDQSNVTYVVVKLLSRVKLFAASWTAGFPVLHHFLEFSQTHVHRVCDAIQPSHSLLSPFPPAFSFFQPQSLFQWVGSLQERIFIILFIYLLD